MNHLKIKKVEENTPKDEVEIDKPIKVKGINTEGNDPNKNIPTSVNFKIPKTLREQRAKNLAKRSTLPSSSTISGTDYLLPYKSTEQIFAPVDLAKGIPDYQEREAFIDANGSKMVSLLDKNKYGIFFENDLYDLATFKEQKYNRKIKEFIDELDENQGFLHEQVNFWAKNTGKLALNIGSIAPLIYGMGKALIEWDSSKIFDHGMFDAWEYMESGLDRQLPVYGGSDVWKTKNGMLELDEEGNPIRKEFLSRFINDPIKTLDRDVAPAATFVAGAVITELISVPLGAMTGGTALVANTARIAAQATRLGLKPINYVQKGMPYLRGLKKFNKLENQAKLLSLSNKYQEAIRLGIAAVRTSGYESSLIARSTQHRTLQKFLEDYHIANGGKVDEHGRVVGDLIEPSKSELAEFERLAADAGVIAWRMNVPLVAGMNFIQVPRIYFKNWRMSSMAAGSTQRWRSGGQAIYKGTWKANVDAKKYIKYLGYTYRTTKGGITESWEEFAQGAMEEGLIDYYSTNYGADAAKEKVEFWDAMSKAGNAYANSVEGRDAMWIGGLMGLIGIRLPIKIDSKTGKYKFNLRGTGFGGALSELRQYRKKIQKARDNAKLLQEDETLSKNFENFFRHTQFQKKSDDAAETGNVKEFKDAEHASFFSVIYNRESLGLGETVLQDLEGTKNMSLEKFNELYGTEAEMFSEESKKEAIAKAENAIKQTLKGIREVNIVTQQNNLFINRVEHAIRNVFKAKKDKVPYIKNRERKQILSAAAPIIEQMSYLYSAALNSLDRSKELQKQIAEETTASFPMEEINKIAAKIATINTATEKAEFKNDARELYKAILQEWKETDPANYNLKIEKVKPLFQDLVKLKIREAEASSLYNALFTIKGLQNFIEFSEELSKLYENQLREELEKKTEENVKNAKSPVIERDEKSENSVFGNSKITNAEVDKSTRKALKEYKELNKELENEDFATLQKATLELLDKHPGFFALVKNRLEQKGLDLEGIRSLEGIKIKQEERNTEYLGSFLQQIEELRQELNEIEKIDPERAHLHSFAARSQPAREGQEQSTEQDESLTDTVDDMFSGEKVGATHVIIQTHDKQFDSNKEPVIDSLTGKPVDDRVKEQDDYYVIDTAKINDPTFLPNKLLKDESSPQYAVFRINNENPFNLQATVDSIVIDVYHKNSETGEETFIGNLNQMYPENPAWLLQLRQDIFNQETNKEEGVSEIAPTNAKRTNELVEKAEKVKQELKATTKAEQELKALKEEKSTLESQIESETKEEVSKSSIQNSITEGEAISIAVPRTFFKERLIRITQFLKGKRRASYTSDGDGNYVADLKTDKPNEKDSLGRYYGVGSQVYLIAEEISRIKKIEMQRKMKMITSPEKEAAIQEVLKDAYKRALKTYEVVEDAPFAATIKERLENFRSQSTQQKPTVSKKELESQKTELKEKLSEIETEIEELEGILAKEKTKKEKEAAKEAKRKLKEKAKEEKAKKELEKKIDEVIETEIKEDDISTIAKEEEVTEEEVKKIVRESVLDHIKKFGNKVIKAPKTRLKKIINKIIKGIMTMIIGGTFIISASAFSYNNDGQVTFSLENAVENLLPNEQAEWAKRYLDKKGLIDVAEEQIVTEEHVPIIKETPKPEKIFELIGTVPDSYRPTDSIMSYRSQWNNADGFRYIPAPVRKDLPKGGLKVSGVVGVGHFLLDASVAPGKEYSHEYNEPYLRRAKKNNDWVPAFTTNKDGSVTIRYKRANDLTKSDLVVSPLRQMPFQDINFDVTKKPEGFKASIKEVVRKDGTGTYLIFKTKDGYSRFSGGSVVFIFKDKHGNTVIRDFAGSINQIQKEGNSIIEQYNLKEGELTLGYHDVGSFSAKPKAKKGTLSSDQWAGFNPEGWTGGALMIPTEGNIEPAVPTEKEGDIGLLGLALLGNLAAVRRKRKEGKTITEEDIQSLKNAKEEILNKIKELEAVVPIEKPIVEPKKESVVDKKVTERISEINKEITKITKKLEKTNIQKLKDNLAKLNRELQELSQALEIKVDLKIDPAFSEIAELEAVEADMTAKQKKTKNKELDDKFGKDKVQRIKTINENFDDIIAQIGQRKINMFFKEGEQIHCK